MTDGPVLSGAIVRQRDAPAAPDGTPPWTERDFALSPATRARVARGVPENTQRSYASRWAAFHAWCADQDRRALPATAETLADYANHLAELGKAPTTISAHLAAVAVKHRLAQLPRPDTLQARKIITAYVTERAENPETQWRSRQAPPLLPEHLQRIASRPTVRAIEIRDLAVTLLAMAGALRRAEVAGLNISDVTFDERGMTVVIRVSKADKSGRGQRVRIGYGGGAACPVRAVRAWLEVMRAVGLTSGPLFPRVDRHGTIGVHAAGRPRKAGVDAARLAPATIQTIIQRTAQRAGVAAPPDPDGTPRQFTGHSARRGFVTAAARAAAAAGRPVDLVRIARHGRWAPNSTSLWGYIDEETAWQDHPGAGLV